MTHKKIYKIESLNNLENVKFKNVKNLQNKKIRDDYKLSKQIEKIYGLKIYNVKK